MASLSAISFFLPIFSFLLVFILIYALLAKTKILGDNKFVALFISLILAAFFIVNASLVDFVQMSASWIVVFFVCLFFIALIIMFTHGKLEAVMKPWVAWVILIALIIFFIISSSYAFAWTLNWDKLWSWAQTDWFGFILLAAIAAIVARVLTK